MSRMSAPAARKRRACSTADSTVRPSWTSPSPEKESGVTLRMPMTWVRAPQEMRVSRRMASFPPDLLRRSRSEEHTSELQSLMRISYAVFCLKKKTKTKGTCMHTMQNTEESEFTYQRDLNTRRERI